MQRTSAYEPAPAGTLDSGSLGVHLLDEVVKRAKVLLDLVGELARRRLLGLLGSSGSKVLPEERVVTGIVRYGDS